MEKHTIVMTDRAKMQVTGVHAVVSFDERSFRMKTEAGELWVKGVSLRIGQWVLEQGRIVIEGEINSLGYDMVDEGKTKTKTKTSAPRDSHMWKRWFS